MSSDRGYYRYVSDLVAQLRPGSPPPTGSFWQGVQAKRLALKIVLSLSVVIAGLYAADYAVCRYRLSRGRGLDSIDVGYLDVIPQKGGRTEFVDAGTQPQTCVNSIFPHFGYPPCWCLRRHREQRTKY